MPLGTRAFIVRRSQIGQERYRLRDLTDKHEKSPNSVLQRERVEIVDLNDSGLDCATG